MRRKKTNMDRVVDEIAKSVAERLLVGWTGQPAGRLVQEFGNKLDGPGWCRGAIEIVVRDAIKEAAR